MPHLACLALALLPPIATGQSTFRPTPAEADVPAAFRMAEATFPYETRLLRTTPNYTVEVVRFPSPVTTDDVENNTVHAEYFRPNAPGKRPAVVVLHILGADFALSRYLAARLADRGVAAMFVKLPYYGERRPVGDKKFLSTDIERSVGSMRQGVLDVRRAAGWLASRPEVDARRLGVTGISLGGIVSALAASVDPNISEAAILLAGGELHEILWAMPEGAKYRKLWVESGRTKDDLKAVTSPCDPITYAHRLKGKRVMMMAGNVDEVIPPASARALWHAAGEPPIAWLDCGHYSAAGFLLPAIRRTADFFADGP
ncbi:MAG TPA: alpha/beta hydrolase family protein [Isosphaeraceae bacterium]